MFDKGAGTPFRKTRGRNDREEARSPRCVSDVFDFAVRATGRAETVRPTAGRPRPAAPRPLPKIEFEKYTLPNGLQVILHVDRKLPIVHVNQWFHVGSKNEKPGRTGFAHLFEHMMFQGSRNAKDEYFTFVEHAGANLQEGGVNGTTNKDRTNYFATVPPRISRRCSGSSPTASPRCPTR